ncbi:hypothetical protein BS50DRAFT_596084 [Corynespora cassiicola Philippines]|uniref:Zn(2)-C6 fungal-type domain-containing protein n=1 Tax=Corynespora cassiicola Philippines TaxID=1448308 RepID=A0A2T2PB79_CORCC|nr:hypothetical protein BS50DRAFT_596084 [Corynespora cassiicola Philippines]
MPSKSRGLRTSTGCLTCRKRRVKCDEGRPRCQNCIRVDRSCTYAETAPAPRRQLRALSSHTEHTRKTSSTSSSYGAGTVPLSTEANNQLPPDSIQPWIPYQISQTENHATDMASMDDNFLGDDTLLPLPNDMSPLPLGPIEWYDQLAQDAISNIQEQNASSRGPRWNFDAFTLSRRQSPRESPTLDQDAAQGSANQSGLDTSQALNPEPWNTPSRIELTSDEKIYFEHYVTAVAPILDLFDSAKHFASIVPHLALRNIGILKSLLAVGASHLALGLALEEESGVQMHLSPGTPASTMSHSADTKRIAEQYYYETLHYLSQNLLYPSYTSSHEILVTAINISTYEMFGATNDSDSENWGRHLKGAFWIQRNQDNDGESIDGLRRAVWWAWLRQDIWAAFREGRPALTIWQPKKHINELTSEELATRIVYLAAKCVQFAATPKDSDIAGYIEAGERLMRMLDAWKRILPSSFEPIPVASSHPSPASPEASMHNQFQPIWIHPSSHAAAIQTYHFARIILLLNQPTTGGLGIYQARGKLLRESMSTICGIAIATQSQNLPSAFVNFQAVYAAALCAETKDTQADVHSVLEGTLRMSKFPARTILNDLVKLWGGVS